MPTPPAPTSWPADPTARLRALAALAERDGDVARFRGGWLLSHPDAVRDLLVTREASFRLSPALRRAKFTLGNGLLTNEGDTYRRQRALIQPSLHPRALGGYAAGMVRHATAATAAWTDGQGVELHREMMRLTLHIVAEALFGTPIGPEADAVSRAMDFNVAMFNRSTAPWGGLLTLLPTPFLFRFLSARRQLTGTLRRFIADRRRSGSTGDDLLSRLLAARDGGGAMSERQLIDECVTLFAAGHETTANALTFTLRLLAMHPAVADRVAAEVDAAAPGGRPPAIDDLPAMPYARAVLAESMRLFPPAWVIGRQAREPVEVNGRPFRRGEVIFVSQWVVHRDGRWWPDPDRFDPDRFTGASDRPRYAYFPFGGGSRLCVGESFAWAEATLVLAVIVRSWRMELTGPADPFGLIPGITLRPAAAVDVRLSRR